jgi:VanZ family protein
VSTAARFSVPVALMALIWVLSSDPDPGPDLGAVQTVASKLAHLVLYAALWTAFAWALRFRRPLLAFVLAVAYGGVDEVHQSHVEGRHGTVGDVLIDAVGAGLAWAAWSHVRRRRRGCGGAEVASGASCHSQHRTRPPPP